MNLKLSSVEAHIGQQIKKRRMTLNLKQHELAKLLKITQQQLSKYERGMDKLPPYRLYQLCKVLSVTPNFFFQGLDSVSICLTEQGNWLVYENLKGQKIQIKLCKLYGTVSDIKVVQKD
ncbi:helix-turn-helix domain-containing protein [Candidatus Odyssella acanthamoebae]|uniref:helix-turn-helix domain-containing protein n=1 Tax=Candidatus Odyssella acanthamoebae TaxID=91604 RepID=UPI0006894556|nr:helix-turn-helix transcriptional regulator [Candidatus Paracaedibacter acanthamoebae]